MSTQDFAKKLNYYSDEPIGEMLMVNILQPHGFELIKSPNLADFFANWTKNVAGLNILDLTHHDELQKNYPDNRRIDLPPLWLLSDQMPFLNEPKVASLADDFLPKPLSVEVFNEAFAFWSASSPLFVNAALDKLASSSSDDLVLKILVSFNDSLNTAITQTFACLAANDILGAAKSCHAIKASAKLVGAQALYNLCLWMEIKKKYQSPVTDKFVAQLKQIFLKSQKYFQILSSVPLNKILSNR